MLKGTIGAPTETPSADSMKGISLHFPPAFLSLGVDEENSELRHLSLIFGKAESVKALVRFVPIQYAIGMLGIKPPLDTLLASPNMITHDGLPCVVRYNIGWQDRGTLEVEGLTLSSDGQTQT